MPLLLEEVKVVEKPYHKNINLSTKLELYRYYIIT